MRAVETNQCNTDESVEKDRLSTDLRRLLHEARHMGRAALSNIILLTVQTSILAIGLRLELLHL